VTPIRIRVRVRVKARARARASRLYVISDSALITIAKDLKKSTVKRLML
jgi:hypothetical protein